ncbi:hypothetical protein S7711_01902 [Stachybotrys chartarum IBT 7711]|uniref:Aminotransferase class I/classII large domain-containing protein n=1 Tax=Stachybotrys chartarum (strain CBS 109288 / IBT 7711) TaxID=1280523 RepID=A0A084AMS9_STACB|nr:hypothetical protein S7711_01902 [Stachybotrys chartarum IBT 7711]KFA75601.1 hypothetical protein S40288_04450 [Stachybotrys chartarum IBT 40288]
MSAPTKRINLLRGWPSPDLLPASLISAATQRILTTRSVYTPILEYGPSAGHPPLRAGLASWLGRHYRVEPDPKRICVTGGASQNIANVLLGFSDPAYTRAVWVVAPCYYLACGIFRDAGFEGRMRAVPEDEQGIDVEALEGKLKALEEEQAQKQEQKPADLVQTYKSPGAYRKFYRHVIYAVPTSSNPSGKTMSLRRREQLVTLARKYDALIIADDVYDFLQWPLQGDTHAEKPPQMRLPRLCDIDLAMGNSEHDPHGFGHAISNGSFSKLVGPGVRTGWVEASPAFVVGLGRTGATLSGGAPSQLAAAILADVIESGDMETWVEGTLRPALQKRHQVMAQAIREHICSLGVEMRESSLVDGGIYGGYFVWLRPSNGLPSQLIAEQAIMQENLVIGFGNLFEVSGDEESAGFDKEIRLCFAWEDPDNIVEGVARLGKLLKRMQDNREHYQSLPVPVLDDSFVDNFK